MPGTTVTKENGRTGKPEHQFKFSSFSRGPPIKMTYTIILVLTHFFKVEPSEEPSARATPKLSYLRCYFVSTFNDNVICSQLHLIRTPHLQLDLLPLQQQHSLSKYKGDNYSIVDSFTKKRNQNE